MGGHGHPPTAPPLFSRRNKFIIFIIAQLLFLYYLFSSGDSISIIGSDSTVKSVDVLRKWTEKGHVYGPPVKVIKTFKGNTMIATEDIPAGVLWEVPFDHFLCPELTNHPSTQASKGWKLIRGEGFEAHYTLPLLLNWEKSRGKSSHFKAYIDTLTPRESLSLPVFWTDEQLQYLEPESIRKDYISEREIVREYYASQVKPFLRAHQSEFKAEFFTLEEFEWSCSMLWSHSFIVYPSAKVKSYAMVPYADLMNHDGEVWTTWDIDHKKRAWVLQTDRDFKAGDEVVISYGGGANNQMMKWFGFAMENNKDDEFYPEWSELRTGPMADRDDLWAAMDCGDYITLQKGKANDLLVNCATIIAYESAKSDGHPLPTPENYNANLSFDVGCQNKVAGIKKALELIDQYRSQYTTTVEEDEVLLKQTTLHPHIRLAIITRHGHKKILNWHQVHLEQLLQAESNRCNKTN